MDSFAGKLINYGALGILSLILIIACVHLFRTLSTERKEHMLAMVTASEKHRTEMMQMVERYIATANTQVSQYHQLADKMNSVLDAFARKLDHRP